MPDKQQPEALRLADELEAPIDGFPEATELESKAAAELRRLHAELETLRAKLKVYEDLGGAADDMQLLRMGYAAARLEIESLKSQSAAQQPGAAYAALPDESYGSIMGAAYDFRDAHISGSVNLKRSAHAALETAVRNAISASHGQAPAGAASVTDAMVLAALQVQYPAGYGTQLRHPANGPKTSERTEAEIDLARRMIAAALATQPAPQQPGVGISGFDHKTAADFLNGKTVSDEAMRKFVAASRWAHDDRAGLQAMLLTVRHELASREAEIALLKTALMNAEAAAKQGGAA